MTRIVCIGSRFRAEDAAGPRVYDRLLGEALPPGVDLVDGGLAGLGLLRFVDGAERVVFVDQVSGFGRPGDVLALDPGDAALAAPPSPDHGGGLPYLLRVLPGVCEKTVPRVSVVGVEGPADERAIARAAALAMELAAGAAADRGAR